MVEGFFWVRVKPHHLTGSAPEEPETEVLQAGLDSGLGVLAGRNPETAVRNMIGNCPSKGFSGNPLLFFYQRCLLITPVKNNSRPMGSQGEIPWANKEEIMWKNLLLVTLAGILVGCSLSAGQKYNVRAADSIGVGQTTEGDLVAMAGMPLSEKKLSNGIKVYDYAYGWRSPIQHATSIDKMQVLVYNGVVINKWHDLEDY
jgi:hypothetical protein